MNRNVKLIAYSFIGLLLVFTALLLVILLSYLVYNTFGDWETIIAGCIGFVGAVLGGLITLIGVKMTINHTKEKEILENLHFRKHALDKTISRLTDAKNVFNEFRREAHLFEFALSSFLNMIDETDGIIDHAATSSKKVYESIIKLDESIRKLMWEKEYSELTDGEKYYLLDVYLLQCFIELDMERQGILSKILEKHPS